MNTPPNPWPENLMCFPKLDIPPHTIDNEGNVIWAENTTPRVFDPKDSEGFGKCAYGSLSVLSLTGNETYLDKWANFFSNSMNIDEKRDFNQAGFKVFYVNLEKFKTALINEHRVICDMRHYLRNQENRDEIIQREAEIYAESFISSLPYQHVGILSSQGVNSK